MGIYESYSELIGATPLFRARRFARAMGLRADILVKLEYLNPTGSVKDRAALFMIDDAERRGLLSPGATIIEPTSGNTGIGLAAAAAARGYSVVLTMPDTMSVERRSLLKAHGARIVLTEGALGMKGAIAKARELAARTPGAYIPGQFENPANARAHFETTGPEIWDDCAGRIDAFVAGVGTGGSITGTGAYLKSKDAGIRVVAVEPAGSPVLSGGEAGPHPIQGIGAGFIPEALDTSVYDEVVTVQGEDAYTAGRLLGTSEGILAGISSGAALWAASRLATRPEYEGKTIVVLAPDGGSRYLSTPMFA